MYCPRTWERVPLPCIKLHSKFLMTLLHMENKQVYAAPRLKMIEVRFEQVLCLSSPDFGDGGDILYND